MIQRKTVQAAYILETVNSLCGHRTADEIYDAVIKTHPTISRGTVYRNLNQLAEAGMIMKIDIPNAAARFEHMTYPHHHVKCVRCGGVSDVDMDYVGELLNMVRDDHGFTFTGYDLTFTGICPKCAGQKSEEQGNVPKS